MSIEAERLGEIFADAFPFWDNLTDNERNDVLRTSQEIRISRGLNIHDGNECTGVILVRSGSLRIYMLSDEGKDITLCRLFEGDICILSASCAFSNITFDVFVDSEEESECIIVGGCAFAALSEKNEEVKIFALESALGFFSEVMWVMQQILFMSLDRRLAIFLLDEIAKTGSDTVRLTHEQIAKYMGSAREVVSRMIKYFVGEGLVTSSRGGITVIDKPRMRKLAG